MPRKPRELKPGPGEYNPSPRVSGNDEAIITKGGFIPKEIK
jgi:hypothetical protein